jgi:ribosome maturation factor RimP
VGTLDDAAPWLAWPLGAKVMVRRRLAEGGYSDTVGILLECDAEHVVVRGRRGDVSVPAAEIAIGKVVPPPRLGPRRP